MICLKEVSLSSFPGRLSFPLMLAYPAIELLQAWARLQIRSANQRPERIMQDGNCVNLGAQGQWFIPTNDLRLHKVCLGRAEQEKEKPSALHFALALALASSLDSAFPGSTTKMDQVVVPSTFVEQVDFVLDVLDALYCHHIPCRFVFIHLRSKVPCSKRTGICCRYARTIELRYQG